MKTMTKHNASAGLASLHSLWVNGFTFKGSNCHFVLFPFPTGKACLGPILGQHIFSLGVDPFLLEFYHPGKQTGSQKSYFP